LQVWSTPRAHLLKDEELRPFPLIANFVVRQLDLGEYPGRDLSSVVPCVCVCVCVCVSAGIIIHPYQVVVGLFFLYTMSLFPL
jgi:hypothetical protein